MVRDDMTRENDPINRRLLIWVFIGGLVFFTAEATYRSDTVFFLNVFVVAPTLLVLSIVSLVYSAFRSRSFGTIVGTLSILWVMAGSFFLYDRAHPFAIRETARWFLWSHEYKRQVLARSMPTNGDLKHIEWDSSGFAGVANNISYLVLDPTDTLLTAAENSRTAKFNGVPCELRAVRRMEAHWYAVLFCADQSWDECRTDVHQRQVSD
jgi:hypothetical protein